MDGKELTYKRYWNVNDSMSEKAGYYGINYVSEGLELCFGKSDYSTHNFKLSYTLSNFVFNTDDSQVVYFTLLPPANSLFPYMCFIIVVIYKEFLVLYYRINPHPI